MKSRESLKNLSYHILFSRVLFSAKVSIMQQITTMRSIMSDFADSTGLTNTSLEPRRYLWTDAFAVCNYLELFRQTGDVDDIQLALKLVDQVHFTLGRFHKDSKNSGWLSGLDEEQARLHPTIAGLRIGK
jgi:hypothetical protein